jgi:hypothetical protein
MNEKYTLKFIQHGKSQQVRIGQNGAGVAGQADLVQATDAACYQLVNVVTFTEHPWLWEGGIESMTALRGGGGGGNGNGATTVKDMSILSAIKAYAGVGATTAPTEVEYTAVNVLGASKTSDHNSSVSRVTLDSLFEIQQLINNTSVIVS